MKESLPELNQEVLALGNYDNDSIATNYLYIHTCWAKGWDITHWMPLPEDHIPDTTKMVKNED